MFSRRKALLCYVKYYNYVVFLERFTMSNNQIIDEINKRRTFAIISHPDAGKTTLTEKFLLYGGAINLAGSVKGKATARHAVSDWMEIEKQRGISVTSSVLQFNFEDCCINILDTPGHQDFSEDTYRTLMAADSAVMVIDASKGVEPQTKKLFKVCTMRHIPIFTFINKLDRDAMDTYELLDDIEDHLGIATCPMNLPIGSGKNFKGIYDRRKKHVVTFQDTMKGTKEGTETIIPMDDRDQLISTIGEEALENLEGEIELMDGAGAEFDLDEVRAGNLTPVFFGSALQNFGVELFLHNFLKMATPPSGRASSDGEVVDPKDHDFTAFVFKIQANMNKAHRDRVAFMRICSGRYDADKEVKHVQSGKVFRLSQPQQLMADERKILSEAYAGDIMGVFDPGIFSIGDTVCMPKDSVVYEGIPTFAPEHFARVRQVDTMKRKQFVKGIEQIAQEGAIQIFQEFNMGMEEIIVGVVGVLQFDVLKFRLQNEYNVEIILETLPYEYIRWVENDDIDLNNLVGTSDMKKIKDMNGKPLLIFINEWSPQMVIDRNKGLVLREFNENVG
jgi:peptide chain release factor 3